MILCYVSVYLAFYSDNDDGPDRHALKTVPRLVNAKIKKQDTKELRTRAVPARAKCTVECHSDILLMTGQCTSGINKGGAHHLSLPRFRSKGISLAFNDWT